MKIGIMLLLLATGCSSGVWGSEMDVLRRPEDICSMSRTFDVVAYGRLDKIGDPTQRSFSPWPKSVLRITPLTLTVEKSLRGDVKQIEAQISAPADGEVVKAAKPLAVGESGWFLGVYLDKTLLLSTDGFSQPNQDKSIHFEYFGSFPSEESFAQAFSEAEKTCPRQDQFSVKQ